MRLFGTFALIGAFGCAGAADDPADRSYETLTPCPAGFVRSGNECVLLDVDEGLCPDDQSCVELADGAGVCATASGELPADAPSCEVTDCASGQLCITASGVAGAFCLDECDPDLGPTEPTPEFTLNTGSGGQIGIDGDGIRTYIYDGEEYLSVLSISLREAEADESCSILLEPAFYSFGTKSTTTRTFAAVTMDLGASWILEDNCGWDDDYILAELDGQYVTVGFTRARFEEDRPYLDVYYPETMTTVVGGGIAWAIDVNGVVDESTTVEPTGGVFVPGVYQW
jgi:hypothetical protein